MFKHDGSNEVKSVYFNDGTDANVFAIVTGESSEDSSTLDLISFDSATAAPQHRKAVPHREPADYGPEGGGDTWHSEPTG